MKTSQIPCPWHRAVVARGKPASGGRESPPGRLPLAAAFHRAISGWHLSGAPAGVMPAAARSRWRPPGLSPIYFLSLFLCLLALGVAQAQAPPTLMQEVISREFSIHIGGVQTPECKMLASREFSVFVGQEPTPPWKQLASREISVVVTTPDVPARISPLVVTAAPTGQTVTLSWADYNQWGQHDVARYDIYIFTRGFTNVTGMTRIAWVPGETLTLTLTNLPAWQDHFFAVVPVDALGGYDPVVNSAGAYVIAREVASRELSMFVGDEPIPPWKQVASREFSIVVTTTNWPAPVTQLTVTPTPTGETVTLCWMGYNQWGDHDVARYDIYMSTSAFTNVASMTRIAWTPGETFTLTLTNLPAWQDHFFAIVPVDALNGYNPVLNYAAGYVIAKEVASREFSVFVGEEPTPPWKQMASREFSIVVSTPDVPAPVTCLGCGFTARDSVNSFSALDLDWKAYNEVGQRDVARYRVYLGPAYFDDVSALSPIMYVPAETSRCTITGLVPYGIYYVAVVAEDALGQFNPLVRSQSAQASVDRVREVRNLASTCGTDWLTFTWVSPEGANPYTNNLLAAYHVYLADSATPVVLDRWATSYTATNLLAGHGYPVRISTLDISNRLSDGATLLAATLAANPAQTEVYSFYGITRVAWERVEPEEVIERFLVYLSETNFTSVAGMPVALSTRGHTADFANLSEGKTYYFAVASKNIAGCESIGMPIRVVAHTPGGPTPPTELRIVDYSEESLSIVISGPVGPEYVLQGSTNLVHWLPLQTNRPTVLPITMTATNGPAGQEFFRVLVR